MPKYISLVNWTDQGIRSYAETTTRAAAAGDLAQRLGGEMTDIYWTMGQYDLVAVGDFPDDESSTAFLLALCSQGNVRSSTLRAFSADEFDRIVGRLT